MLVLITDGRDISFLTSAENLCSLYPHCVLCSDHPIHPPRTETDPWECPVLEDCGYKVDIVQVSSDWWTRVT